MSKLIAAVATVALAIPAAAQAAAPRKQERKTYLGVRHALIVKHGKRAPGRQILKYGIKTKHGSRPATAAEVARTIRNMRALLHPYLAPAPPPLAPAGTLTPRAPAGGLLAKIAACESGGDPTTNTGNGFYGKFQFTLSSWRAAGGTGNPAAASEAEQDARAARLMQIQGPGAWPVCSR